MCTICRAIHVYQPDCAYRPVPGWEGTAAQLSAAKTGASRVAEAVLPVFTLDQIAFQLTDAYWTSLGDVRAGFNASVGDTITVDITALTAAGKQLARWALEAWTTVSGLLFAEVGSGAQITFDDEESGAYATSSLSGGYLSSSFVNISKFDWLPVYGTTIDSYSFQTYIHEIGHALGLGHAGHYNGAAVYSETGSGDNHYLNDSWQATVMSYFDQQENTYIDDSRAYTATAMQADIIAIQDLYGTGVSHNPGDTTYGANSNAGGYLGALFGQIFGEDPADPSLYSGDDVTFTVFDTGGTDTLDLSPAVAAQTIDLGDAAISDVLGLTGNLSIARGTVIENAIGGGGNDSITGNSAANVLKGQDGSDTLAGGSGSDTLFGGIGADTLQGDGGNDTLVGEGGSDLLQGGGGQDRLYGRGGNDVLNGDAGNDTLAGQAGSDTLKGGVADDILLGGADDDLLQGEGAKDKLYGEAGNDTLEGGADKDMLFGSVGDDLLRGGSGADTLFGGIGADTLQGGGGNDTLAGEGGNDLLQGGGGQDRLYGRGGNDVLNGDAGNDTLAGQAGSDTLKGGVADDILLGGDDGDLLQGQGASDKLYGEAGNDTLQGGDGADTLFGGAGNDLLQGQGGPDVFVFAEAFGNDTLSGFNVLATDERISLAGVAAITDFADLSDDHMSQSGADVLIDDLAGNTITVTGVSLADLTEDRFLF